MCAKENSVNFELHATSHCLIIDYFESRNEFDTNVSMSQKRLFRHLVIFVDQHWNSDFELYSLLWKPQKSKKIVLPLQALAWLLLACYISNFSIKISPHLHAHKWGQIFYEVSYFFHEIVTQSKPIKVWKIFHKINGIEKFKHYFKNLALLWTHPQTAALCHTQLPALSI